MFLWQIRKYKLKTGNEREQNICVVVIYLTKRAQRTRRTSLSSNNIFIILCALCALCVRKQNIRVVVIISRKERRERGVLIPMLFTLTLEMSQVSLRRESAEVGWQTNIVNNYWFSPTSAHSCRA